MKNCWRDKAVDMCDELVIKIQAELCDHSRPSHSIYLAKLPSVFQNMAKSH